MFLLLSLLACDPHTLPADTGAPGAGGADTSSYVDDTGIPGDTQPADTGTDDSATDDSATDDSAADTATDDSATDTAIGDDTAVDTGTPPDDTAVEDTGTDDTYTDVDGDGWSVEGGDCNDLASAVNPAAVETPGNTVDENCDGVVEPVATDTGTEDTGTEDTGTEDTGTEDTGPTYTDGDADGWSVEGGDCDDADATVNPAAIETANDGVDNDCDGVALVTETDADSDGYGVSVDCDDTDAAINPGAAEVCDGVDQNCDGTADEGVTTHVYRDADGDGYGDELSGTDACGVPSGYVTTVYDCNESDASIHTGATEIPNDGIDQDCDSADLVVEADADSDGYSESADCDDSDATVNPGATETLDGVDQDCDGTVDNDTGIEGYILATYPSSKTLQMNAQVYWDASELGSWWDESSASTVGEDVDVTLTTAEYGDLTGSCGVRFNVSEGSPARDWLCVGGSVDSSVDLDVYYDGTWYDESDIEVWDAGYGDGSCSAILIVSTDADCQI